MAAIVSVDRSRVMPESHWRVLADRNALDPYIPVQNALRALSLALKPDIPIPQERVSKELSNPYLEALFYRRFWKLSGVATTETDWGRLGRERFLDRATPLEEKINGLRVLEICMQRYSLFWSLIRGLRQKAQAILKETLPAVIEGFHTDYQAFCKSVKALGVDNPESVVGDLEYVFNLYATHHERAAVHFHQLPENVKNTVYKHAYKIYQIVIHTPVIYSGSPGERTSHQVQNSLEARQLFFSSDLLSLDHRLVCLFKTYRRFALLSVMSHYHEHQTIHLTTSKPPNPLKLYTSLDSASLLEAENQKEQKRSLEHDMSEKSNPSLRYETMLYSAKVDPLLKVDIHSGKFEAYAWGHAETQGKRAYMEDMFVALTIRLPDMEPILYFAILDGHAGSACALYYKVWFRDIFTLVLQKERAKEGTAFDEEKAAASISRCLKRASYLTHRKFLRQASPADRVSGSTLTSIALYKDFVITENAGDSRTIFSTSSGAMSLSADAILSDKEVFDTLKKRGAWVNPVYQPIIDSLSHAMEFYATSRTVTEGFTLNMGASIGDGRFQYASTHLLEPITRMTTHSIEALREKLDGPERKFFILVSDGFTADVATRQVPEALHYLETQKKLGTPETIAQKLLELAYYDGSTDNISVLVVEVPLEISSPPLSILSTSTRASTPPVPIHLCNDDSPFSTASSYPDSPSRPEGSGEGRLPITRPPNPGLFAFSKINCIPLEEETE